MKIDWKLKGFNLLKFNCNKNAVVHPETCSDMVQMEHDGTLNLTDWIKSGTSSIGDNLADWITTNLGDTVTIDTSWNPNINNLDNNNSVSLGYIGGAVNNPVRVPYTTYSQIGLLGINSDSSFNVSNGILGLNAASSNYYGGIKTGFVDIPAQNKYKVELDSNGKAYVNIGNIVAQSYLYSWNIVDSRALTGLTATVYNASDIWNYSQLDLGDLNGYDEFVRFLFKTPPTTNNLERIYPIRADHHGLLFAFVPWENHTLYRVSGTDTLQWDDSTINIVPRNNVSFTGTPTTNCLTKFNSNGTITNGPALGVGTTTYLRNDGTWHTPYDIANVENPVGLLNVSDVYPNTTGCTIIEPTETPTTVVPVRLDEDNKIHIVVVDDIVEAVVKDSALAASLATVLAPALATVLNNDAEVLQAWKSALGI